MREVLSRIAALFRRRKLDRDLEDELRSHLEEAVAANLRKGMDPAEARRAAVLRLGGVEQTKELYRDQRGFRLVGETVEDLRYGLRMLAKSPGFTAVAVLSLALGIGANTAIFTLIDAVMLRMLPIEKPEELVALRWAVPRGKDPAGAKSMDGSAWDDGGKYTGTSFSYPMFQQIRSRNQAFTDVFAFASLGGQTNIVAGSEAGLARGDLVTGNYFATLGVRPLAGRLLDESDDRLGAPPVCVISHGYWKRRFGGDAAIAGKPVVIAGVPFTVAGVTAAEFFGVEPGVPVDFWVPLSAQPAVSPDAHARESLFTTATKWWIVMMGRLKPGVLPAQAEIGLNAIFNQSLPPDDRPRSAIARLEAVAGGQGLDQLRRRFSRPLEILMGVAGLVLLIACANVANLLLSRAGSRRREIGVRLSLGASRGRLVRQLLVESLLLASLGGALGLALAQWGSRLLVSLISTPGRPLLLEASPDTRVLAFTAAACLLTGLLFGLAPAWRATRFELTPALKQSTRGLDSGPARLGAARTLVVIQVALSLVLLFGAGLFVRTLVNLMHIDTGFDTDRLLLFGVNPRNAGYKDSALADFYSRVQEQISSLPGVTSATASLHLLLAGFSRSNSFEIEGYTRKPDERSSVRVMPVGPKFFETLKIPLVRGRTFDQRDNENSPRVAVINRAFVKRYFGDRDPIGRRISPEAGNEGAMEIVGVAADARYDSLRREPPPTLYQPFRQANRLIFMHYELRTSRDPHSLIPEVRKAVAAVDSNVPIFDVKTQSEQIGELLLEPRLFAKLTSFFGLLALALAAVGLYGILSYAVARRTSEIGIRMALGAARWDILWMVQQDTMRLAAIGLALGIPAALLAVGSLGSLMSDLLYGLTAADLGTLGMAAGLLTAVAALAGFLPSRRASRVEPVVALRHE